MPHRGVSFNHMVKSKDHELDLIFQALADPTRRTILKNLSRRERAVTELAEPFDISLTAVSKHVKVLERAQLVERRWEGNFSYLRLNAKAMQTADEWLEHYRKFWEQSLDRLDDYLREMKKREKREKT